MDGLVKATQTVGSLNQDPTNADPYDNLGQVAVHLVDVPAGASRLVAEILAAEMPDLDMFVGTGSTPSPRHRGLRVGDGEQPRAAATSRIPQAGTWWVLIQNWEGTTAQPDDYTLSTGAVAGDAGNADVVGPSGPIPPGQPYDVRVTLGPPAVGARRHLVRHRDPRHVAGDPGRHRVVPGDAPPRPGRRDEDGVGRRGSRRRHRSPTRSRCNRTSPTPTSSTRSSTPSPTA